MFSFLFYVLTAGIAGWIFKLVAGLIEGVFIFGLGGLLTGFKGSFDERMEIYPKRLFFVILFKNVIIGSLNALMIFIVTTNFMLRVEGNFWVYVIASIFWSLLLLSYTPAFTGMYFATSTVSLILMWLGFSILAPIIVAPLTFFISLAYYYGRINMLMDQEEMKQYFTG